MTWCESTDCFTDKSQSHIFFYHYRTWIWVQMALEKLLLPKYLFTIHFWSIIIMWSLRYEEFGSVLGLHFLFKKSEDDKIPWLLPFLWPQRFELESCIWMTVLPHAFCCPHIVLAQFSLYVHKSFMITLRMLVFLACLSTAIHSFILAKNILANLDVGIHILLALTVI